MNQSSVPIVIVVEITSSYPPGDQGLFGVLGMFLHALTFVLFSVMYKHVNGKGVNSLYLTQTGLP